MNDETLTKRMGLIIAVISIASTVGSGIATYSVMNYRLGAIEQKVNQVNDLDRRITTVEVRVSELETGVRDRMTAWNAWREDISKRSASCDAKLDLLLSRLH